MYLSVRSSWLRELDNQIENGVQYLDVHLRRLPVWFLRGDPPPPPGERPPPGAGGPPGAQVSPRGLPRLLDELRLPLDPDPPPGAPPPDPLFFEIRRHDGSILKSSGVPASLSDWFSPDELHFETTLETIPPFRLGVMTGPAETSILVGRGHVAIHNRLVSFGGRLWFFGLIAMILGLGGGWVVATGILDPIRQMAREMAMIRATDLSRRIAIDKTDTELKGLGAAINETLDRLEASFQLQTRFSADASHEMRTPLAAIRSQCEMALRRDRSAEEYREALQAALRGAHRLESLVNDLLVLSRAESAADPVNQTEFELQPVLEEVVQDCEKLAQSRSITISTNFEPTRVKGNALDLERLFSNLIRNGILHNRDGGQVWIRMKSEQDWIIVEIEDNGPGISPEAVPHLGERFFRADPSRTSGGSGLGLAISRGIIQAHQGTLDCESQLGKGSLFRVKLPRIAQAQPHTGG